MMIDEPELVKAMLNKYCDINLEIYERMFTAAGDRVDLLRACDDYGTQRASCSAWRCSKNSLRKTPGALRTCATSTTVSICSTPAVRSATTSPA